VNYVEALLRTSRQAVADHKARAVTAAGVSAAADPEFAPGPSAKRMDGDPARGNLLPAASGDGRDWRLFGDWTCFGFVPRGYSFETAPYLPELMVAPGLSSGGKAVRIAHPDPKVHLWCWRADPDLADGAVTIPLEPLREEGTERDNWGHVAEKAPAGLRYLDGVLGTYATWYATTRLHAEVACRAWMAVRMNWDGRLWVNGSLIWRPARIHTPDRLAVVPVELKAGENRITVCVSPQPTSDGNSGKQGPWIYKYGERSYGSFALWVSAGGGPRPAAEVAGAAEAQASADRRRAQQVAARGIRGRRGDGSGRYPDAKPPLAWDLEKGINVRWKAALPTDDAEAVIVGDPAGDGAGRLFVTTYKGELACLDAATGKELWRRTPEVSGDLPPYPAPAVAASFAPARRWKAGGTGRQGFPETLSADFPAYARSCLTPVAGGRRVWMHDPRGRVACFDHDGRQAWAVAVPAQVPRFVCGGYVEYRVVPPTPPAMVGSRLVAAVGRGLAAFDADKGTELWRRDPLDYNGHFGVMDFGDGPRQQLVLLSSCEVLDAATGETLIPRCAPLMPDSTCQPVVEGRVAYFNACSSAVRFWTDGRGDLRRQVLWDSPTDVRKRRADQNAGRFNGKADPDFFGQSTGAFPPTPVLYDGLLFVHLAELNSIDHGPQNSLRLQTYDAATGCAVAQRYALVMNGMRPGSSAVVAGGYLFMADEGSEIAGHYPDFPKSVPMIAVATAEDQPRRIAQSRGLATLAPPVFDGRRIYLAGSDQVVCIERPEALGDRFSEYELAALKDGLFMHEIGRQPGVGKDVVVPPATGLAVGEGVPVVSLISGETPGRWLFAGPFAVDEKADVFSEQGGAGKVYPRAGQKVAYTAADGSRAEATFVLLEGPSAPSKDRGVGSKNPLIDATYAAALGNARLEGGVNFAVASGRKYNTTCYAYAVLDVTQAGRYRVETIVGRIKNSDIYLAGERLDHEMVVTLSRGRYPLMVRAAIAACQSHEPIEWAIQFRALPAGEPAPPPRPITGSLPAGARAPVAPLRIGGGVSPLLASRATTASALIGGGLPPALLGAWPLPAEGRDDPGAAVTALPGGLAGEGSVVTLDGVKTEFRAVPAEAVVGAGGITDRHTFNVAQPTAGYGLDLKALFGDAPPARGLFFAVLENRRAVTVEVTCPSHARCWLSGREIRDAETVRLAPGLYPFLLECRATGEAKGKPAALAFSEVADPRLAAQRWLARVRRNEALLRAIAESGPAGAYAREALAALRSEP
jgi:outer membrane protein assembly factor BamB